MALYTLVTFLCDHTLGFIITQVTDFPEILYVDS